MEVGVELSGGGRGGVGSFLHHCSIDVSLANFQVWDGVISGEGRVVPLTCNLSDISNRNPASKRSINPRIRRRYHLPLRHQILSRPNQFPFPFLRSLLQSLYWHSLIPSRLSRLLWAIFSFLAPIRRIYVPQSLRFQRISNLANEPPNVQHTQTSPLCDLDRIANQ